MLKKICKIFVALISSVLFAMLNFNALSYGNLLMNANHAIISEITPGISNKIPKESSQPQSTSECNSERAQKSIAKPANTVLNSPSVSTTNCAN